MGEKGRHWESRADVHLEAVSCMRHQGASILDGLGLIQHHPPPVDLEQGPCHLLLPFATCIAFWSSLQALRRYVHRSAETWESHDQVTALIQDAVYLCSDDMQMMTTQSRQTDTALHPA